MFDILETELLFFKVIDDLKEYLDDLVVVGGWLAYLYTKFLWKNVSIEIRGNFRLKKNTRHNQSSE